MKIYIVWEDDRWPEGIFFNIRLANEFAKGLGSGWYISTFETEDEPVKMDPYYAE